MGALLLIVGLVLLATGTRFYLSLKRLTAAPFRKTGDVAKDAGLADVRGMIATEGEVKTIEIVRAPCCGQASVAYEVTIDREWEKPASADGGARPSRGKTRIVTNRGGAVFKLDDGSGPVTVDAREGVAADLVKSHEERVPVGMVVPGEVVFGHMRMQTPVGLAQDRTVAFHAVERILPAQGRLYVCGRLAGGVIARAGWASLVLSSRGRNALVGGTKAKAVLGLGVGALCTVGSIPLFLGAMPTEPPTAHVESVTVASAPVAPSAPSIPPPPAVSETPPPPPPPPQAPPRSTGHGGPGRPRH